MSANIMRPPSRRRDRSHHRHSYSTSRQRGPVPGEELGGNHNYASIHSTPIVSKSSLNSQDEFIIECDYLEESDHSDYENAWLAYINYITTPTNHPQANKIDSYTDTWLKYLNYELHGNDASSTISNTSDRAKEEDFIGYAKKDFDDYVKEDIVNRAVNDLLIDVSSANEFERCEKVPITFIKFEPLVKDDELQNDKNDSDATAWFKELFGENNISCSSLPQENGMIDVEGDKCIKGTSSPTGNWKTFAEQNEKLGYNAPSWQAPAIVSQTTLGPTDDLNLLNFSTSSKEEQERDTDDFNSLDFSTIGKVEREREQGDPSIKYSRSEMMITDFDTKVGLVASRLIKVYLDVHTNYHRKENESEKTAPPVGQSWNLENVTTSKSIYYPLRQPRNSPSRKAKGFNPGVP